MKSEKDKLDSIKKMKEIMAGYYMEAKTAGENGKKTAWITSGGPVEPLIAMDVIPVYPENHAAMIGSAKMGVELCEKAEEMGYPRDVCSYARADIASAIVNGGPIGGLPRPDMLVCCNNICGTVLKWYEILARYFSVPLFILDTPISHTGFTKETRKYVGNQLGDFVKFLEEHCGKKFDFDYLNEVGRHAIRAQQLWQEVLDTAVHKPAPISAFDAFFHLALIVTLRGTEIVTDYYEGLLAEMKQRVKEGFGVVQQEKYRLLWDNLPIWFRTRWLSDTFVGHNACIVADTYTNAWCGHLKYFDENNFFESMAEGYSRIYLNIGVDMMAEKIIEMTEKFDVDGVVMHSNRSCKPYSFGQYDIADLIRKKRNIPVLMLEADMLDSRNFSESQAETRIGAFMELLQ